MISECSRDTENCDDCRKLSFLITGINYTLNYTQKEILFYIIFENIIGFYCILH